MVINTKFDFYLHTQNAKDSNAPKSKIYGSGTIYKKALQELQEGKKRSHWMRYIFPQSPNPGMNKMLKSFALTSKEEARRYLEHRVLGERLIECTKAVLRHKDKTLEEIFGSEPDAKKFINSMHLFKDVGGEESVFLEALRVFEEGEE
jgi:uncharacterized protein (DUF1810 family)